MKPLYEAYRPASWESLVGQDKLVQRLSILRRRGLVGRVFWVTSESGSGKTTVAKLIAAEIADDYAVIEIDAQDLGIDKVREFERMCQYKPIGKGCHVFIANESHGLSSKVVSRLQTVLEQPHVQRNSTWIFTTTFQGQKRLFDGAMDACPFMSRTIELPLSIGIPGVAKTAFFAALSQATQRRFIPYMLDQSLPEDLKGYPLVQDIEADGRTIRAMVHVLEEARLRAELEPSVVLLDELTCAGHSIQAAALQWVNNPSPNCWMFAAANPPDKAAAGVDLTPPMVNRLCVIPWETPVEAIRQGWRNGLEFPTPAVPLVPTNWRDHLPKWGCWSMTSSSVSPIVWKPIRPTLRRHPSLTRRPAVGPTS